MAFGSLANLLDFQPSLAQRQSASTRGQPTRPFAVVEGGWYVWRSQVRILREVRAGVARARIGWHPRRLQGRLVTGGGAQAHGD